MNETTAIEEAPHAAHLKKAGVESLDDLRERAEAGTLAEIKGISAARAGEITAWLAAGGIMAEEEVRDEETVVVGASRPFRQDFRLDGVLYRDGKMPRSVAEKHGLI